MSDIINGILNGQIPEGVVSESQQTTSDPAMATLNARIAAQKSEIEGIHEVLKSEVVTQFGTLNRTQANILEQLSVMIPQGLKPLIDLLKDQYETTEDQHEKDKSDDPLKEKSGKKDWTNAEVASKVPTALAAGSLLLYNQIDELTKGDGLFAIMGKNLDTLVGFGPLNKKEPSEKKDGSEEFKTNLFKSARIIIESIQSINADVLTMSKTIFEIRDQFNKPITVSMIKDPSNGQTEKEKQPEKKDISEEFRISLFESARIIIESIQSIDSNILTMSKTILEIREQFNKPINVSMIKDSYDNPTEKEKQPEKKDDSEEFRISLFESARIIIESIQSINADVLTMSKTILEIRDQFNKPITVSMIKDPSNGPTEKEKQPEKKDISEEFKTSLFESTKIIIESIQSIDSNILTMSKTILEIREQFNKPITVFVESGTSNDPIKGSSNDEQKKKDNSGGVSGSNKGILDNLKEFNKDAKSIADDLLGVAGKFMLLGIMAVPAIIGLKLTTILINDIIKMADKLDEKQVEKIQALGEAFAEIGKGFGIFVVVLILIGVVLPLMLIPAFFGLLAISAFIFLIHRLGFQLKSPAADKANDSMKKGSKDMMMGLLLFVVVIVLVAVLMPIFLMAALPWLILIGVFFFMFIGIATLVSSGNKQLQDFAKGSILLTVALLLFAVALVVINRIIAPLLKPETMMTTLGIIALFLLFVIIGAIASSLMTDMVKFAIASMLLTIALVMFGVALVVLSKFVAPIITKNLQGLIVTLAAILIVFVFAAVIGLAAMYAIVPIIFFAVTSIILAISLIIFWVAMLVLSELIMPMIGEFDPKKSEDNRLIKVLGFITSFLIAVAWFLPVVIPAAIASVFLLVTSVLMLVSFLAFWGTLVVMERISEIIVTKKEDLLLGLAGIGILMAATVILGVVSAFSIGFIVMLVAASVAMMIAYSAIGSSMKSLLNISNLVDELGSGPESKMYKAFEVTGYMITQTGKLGLWSLLTIGLIGSLARVSIDMSNVFKQVVVAYESMGKIADIQDKIDPKPILEAVKQLIDITNDAGKKMKGKSLEAAQVFATTLKSITDAIDSIADTYIKLAFFGTPEGEKLMAGATESLEKVIEIFRDNVLPILNHESFKEISEKKLLAAQALVPITEAIDNITDTVLKIGDIEISQIGKAITSLTAIGDFINDNLMKFIGNIQGGEGSSVGLKSLFVGKEASSSAKADELVKTIESIHRVAESIIAMPAVGLEPTKNITDLNAAMIQLQVVADVELKPFKANIERNIIDPINKLRGSLVHFDNLQKGIRNLNSELKKLTKDNGDVLKDLSNLGGMNASKMKSTSTAQGSKPDLSNPLESIAEDVAEIRNSVAKTPSSWTKS